jgi:hypothetical protein
MHVICHHHFIVFANVTIFIMFVKKTTSQLFSLKIDVEFFIFSSNILDALEALEKNFAATYGNLNLINGGKNSEKITN